MSGIILPESTPEQNRFESISDFKWSMRCGGEIEFIWNNVRYGIAHTNDKIIVYRWKDADTLRYFDTADDALEYMVGNDRLRDVITRVTVVSRTI